jgi:alkanesulfonate monooxygenase SsuD/methylene tetrahydromethanopterin reductase-like flavin-dependent oxidoreductase (luciferase family)
MAWRHPKAVNFDYLNVADWVESMQELEGAKFDGIFWADHSGVHDTYQGSWATLVRKAVQFPLGDPLLLTAALASATGGVIHVMMRPGRGCNGRGRI